jgi:hypothetical protein
MSRSDWSSTTTYHLIPKGRDPTVQLDVLGPLMDADISAESDPVGCRSRYIALDALLFLFNQYATVF